MADETPSFDLARAASFILSAGHAGWLGLEWVDAGDDWVELKLPWRADLIGEPERAVLASGPIISLMDMVSGMACWRRRDAFIGLATLDLRVDYQRPARERADVIGRAECYRMTRSAFFVRGIAHDGDASDPVANIAGVFMVIGKSRPLPEGMQA